MSRSRTKGDGGNDTTGAGDRLTGCRVGVKEDSDSVGNAVINSVGSEEGAPVKLLGADGAGVRVVACDGCCVGDGEGTSNSSKSLRD